MLGLLIQLANVSFDCLKSGKMISDFDDINLREREILKYLVTEYICTAQPVSSLALADKNILGCSSATIRSIFADLDQKKYIYSPHRSSGRMPTEKAYRFFVESYPEMRISLGEDERRLIQKEYLKSDFQMEEILDVTCRILSILTDYTGVVIGPDPDNAVLKHLELINMGQDELLIVLVTRSGTVYNKTMFLDTKIPGDFLPKISRMLNELYKGSHLYEIRNSLIENVEVDSRELLQYYPIIAKTIQENFDLVRGNDVVFTSGVDKLFSLYAGNKSKKQLDVVGDLFESRDYLTNIFKRSTSLDDVSVLIDGDRDTRLSGLSIVSASYKMGERKIGSIGIVGPNRMDYTRVISVVEYISMLISGMITRISN